MSMSSHPFGRRLIHFIAFGFGAGKIPFAPGTFGTLAAVPIYLLLRETGLLFYAVVTIALFGIGVWCCSETERDFGTKDMSAIVWDEIVGFLVAMFAVPAGWGWLAAGFLLFRLFDIWKPYPIRRLERMPGGFGVMIDDVLAGVYACLVLHVAALLLA